ncbi:hypothetical protein [Streptomyces avidinii]
MTPALKHSVRAPATAYTPAPPAPPASAPPPDHVNALQSAQQLMKSLEKIAQKGGTFTTDPDIKPYAFYGTKHLSLSQTLQENLWKFGLSPTARNILDHMTTHHNDQALTEITQKDLAAKFGCSQSKISRAITQLTRHNFTWKETRGTYRLHPLYAYRWGSRKQHTLLTTLGHNTLTHHQILIPTTP